MVRCTVHLYLPPGWELGEGGAVEPEAVGALGDDLRERCRQAAGMLAALRGRGWRLEAGRYAVTARKGCDRAAAMRDFLRLGLDPVRLTLEEEPGDARGAVSS